ncbi:MAG: site-specific integrase [Clostridia bacterium]|nr:site-specific integrase [Bacillota bacterium]MBQ4434581.1 site-specific integrase [Clostridia bacterium]
MSVTKDKKTGKWMAQVRVKDETGKTIHRKKRGFATKRAAQEWESGLKGKDSISVGMRFADFAERYLADMEPRIKASTMETKRTMIYGKIVPFFGSLPLGAIDAAKVRQWQSGMVAYRKPNGKPYSMTYLKTLNCQLSAMFSYAVRYYRLKENPCRLAGSIGKKAADEMQFWTKDEFAQFLAAVRCDPPAFTMFSILYYTGLREGELLALTPEDVDLKKRTIRVNKTYSRTQRRDVVTPPKTPKSVRTVAISDGLAAYLADYVQGFGPADDAQRLFPYTKHYLYRWMGMGCEASGVKRIRIHDLRHSHASLLVELGFSPLLIAERLGHERVQTTMDVYSHLYPNKQREVAERLNELMIS